MTAIQICALISIATAACILYWIGYRGGLADGRAEGHEKGYTEGYDHGFGKAYAAFPTAIALNKERRERVKQFLARQPEYRLILLSIAEKLKLAAVTFKAVKSETHAAQALALREKALSIAVAMDLFEQGDAA
ncbi:Yae1 family protein [Pseudomonas sp. F1002]|uniref:Yae1 family protein n=1 Tax=Pseudomonas sp. F1002 TaxID=2738821 RepID=UPI0015A349C5|nr:Yae1 family protein [Pseudomonas sp. F1002]NWB63936.1 Yae1 family protein [Pseudomonas sp. F1002]